MYINRHIHVIYIYIFIYTHIHICIYMCVSCMCIHKDKIVCILHLCIYTHYKHTEENSHVSVHKHARTCVLSTNLYQIAGEDAMYPGNEYTGTYIYVYMDSIYIYIYLAEIHIYVYMHNHPEAGIYATERICIHIRLYHSSKLILGKYVNIYAYRYLLQDGCVSIFKLMEQHT